MARPTKFKEEYQGQCKAMASFGLTDKQMSKVLGVTEQTFNNWKIAYAEFFESLKEGKSIADKKVEEALYNRALGYSHEDTKFATHEGIITDQKTYMKHYAPDTTACIYWLNNRNPEKWRNSSHIETKDISDKPRVVNVISEKDIENLGKLGK